MAGVCASHYMMVLLLSVVLILSSLVPQSHGIYGFYGGCYDISRSTESYYNPLYHDYFYGIVKVEAGTYVDTYNASEIDWLIESGLVDSNNNTAVTTFSHPALCYDGGLWNTIFHEFECSEANARHMLQIFEDTKDNDPFLSNYKRTYKISPPFRTVAPDPHQNNFACWKVSSPLRFSYSSPNISDEQCLWK